jgi:F-type H+-transporting ATPase subunit epsilon
VADMRVDVVSAERRLYSGTATEVYARSLDGEIGLMAGHQPIVLALERAPVRIKPAGGQDVVVAAHHGFLQFRDDHLIVLADIAELVDEIDPDRATAARDRAQQRLSEDSEDGEAHASLGRAELRLRVLDEYA